MLFTDHCPGADGMIVSGNDHRNPSQANIAYEFQFITWFSSSGTGALPILKEALLAHGNKSEVLWDSTNCLLSTLFS